MLRSPSATQGQHASRGVVLPAVGALRNHVSIERDDHGVDLGRASELHDHIVFDGELLPCRSGSPGEDDFVARGIVLPRIAAAALGLGDKNVVGVTDANRDRSRNRLSLKLEAFGRTGDVSGDVAERIRHRQSVVEADRGVTKSINTVGNRFEVGARGTVLPIVGGRVAAAGVGVDKGACAHIVVIALVGVFEDVDVTGGGASGDLRSAQSAGGAEVVRVRDEDVNELSRFSEEA